MCSEHGRRLEYFEYVPFGNVTWVTPAKGDSTLMSEEEVGV